MFLDDLRICGHVCDDIIRIRIFRIDEVDGVDGWKARDYALRLFRVRARWWKPGVAGGQDAPWLPSSASRNIPIRNRDYALRYAVTIQFNWDVLALWLRVVCSCRDSLLQSV